MLSDNMQDIAKYKPDEYQNGDPPAKYLESPEGIDPIGVVAIITANNVTVRAFSSGFIMSRFFLALFHERTWEGTL